MQRGKQRNFKQRAVFYTSRLISEQVPKGERAKWAYAIKELYLIALLEDFAVDASEGYLHDICLINKETGQVFYKGLRYIFIELPKFVKTEAELESDLDKWLYVLKNMSHMDKLPVYLRKPIFEKLFNIAEYSKLTREENTMFDASMKRKWDNEAVLDYARTEGRKRGEEEGRKEAALDFVKRLIEGTDHSDKKIADLAAVSLAFVQKVREELRAHR